MLGRCKPQETSLTHSRWLRRSANRTRHASYASAGMQRTMHSRVVTVMSWIEHHLQCRGHHQGVLMCQGTRWLCRLTGCCAFMQLALQPAAMFLAAAEAAIDRRRAAEAARAARKQPPMLRAGDVVPGEAPYPAHADSARISQAHSE